MSSFIFWLSAYNVSYVNLDLEEKQPNFFTCNGLGYLRYNLWISCFLAGFFSKNTLLLSVIGCICSFSLKPKTYVRTITNSLNFNFSGYAFNVH